MNFNLGPLPRDRFSPADEGWPSVVGDEVGKGSCARDGDAVFMDEGDAGIENDR